MRWIVYSFAALSLVIAPLGLAQSSSASEAINAEGNRAYLSARYDEALVKFERALKIATDDGDPQYVAIAMYGLARANAHLCNVQTAETWFSKSIAARDALRDETYAYLTQNLIEYARFLMVHGKAAEAVPLLDRAAPLLVALKVERSDPIAYAEMLDFYASALKQVGRNDDAASATEGARSLRETNPGRNARFRPETYPTTCATRKP